MCIMFHGLKYILGLPPVKLWPWNMYKTYSFSFIVYMFRGQIHMWGFPAQRRFVSWALDLLIEIQTFDLLKWKIICYSILSYFIIFRWYSTFIFHQWINNKIQSFLTIDLKITFDGVSSVNSEVVWSITLIKTFQYHQHTWPLIPQ